MQKRRFNKKKILGILKSYHAKQRQKERNVSDQQLIKILQNGELDKRSEYEIIITLEGYHIYLSLDLDKIITITSPDTPASKPKILDAEDAKKIKDDLIHKEEIQENTEDITFEEYMKKEFK